MMPAEPPRPHTALTLLFGPGDAAEALDHAIVSADARGNLGGALEHLPTEVRAAAVREVAAAAAGLLDVNLADMLIAGWREHQDLTAAARWTLAAPGRTELVDLAEHKVSSSQEPYVSVLVDGRQLATVRLGLTVVFDVTAMLAGVSGGRLVSVRSGDCDITGTLAIDEAEVVTKRTRLKLPGIITLHQGIRLLPASAYPPAAEPAPAADPHPSPQEDNPSIRDHHPPPQGDSLSVRDQHPSPQEENSPIR
jgi:hypothetical protein